MGCKNKLIKIILIVFILAGGAYSFNYLSFLSKANPANLVEAIQSINSRDSTFQQGFRCHKQGHKSTSFEGPRGLGGPGGRHGNHFGQGNAGFNSLGNLLAFLGVFASTLTVTYIIDQFFRNQKVLR